MDGAVEAIRSLLIKGFKPHIVNQSYRLSDGSVALLQTCPQQVNSLDYYLIGVWFYVNV